MLFKVSHPARLASDPNSAPLTLHPQFEANDEAHAREKHKNWLLSTGYALVAEEAELEAVAAALVFELLSDEGFDPDVQQVQSLEQQVSNLQEQLAAAGNAPALLKQVSDELTAAQGQVVDLTSKLSQASTDLSTANTQLAAAANSVTDLAGKVQALEQTVADKDSQLATLSAQLQEALAKASPAASPTPPADGAPPAP